MTMTHEASTKFLITGAGGRTGATGNHAVRQLLARQLPVRAFVLDGLTVKPPPPSGDF